MMVEPANRLSSFNDLAATGHPGASGRHELVVLDASALAQLRALDPDGKLCLVEKIFNTYITAAQELLEQLDLAVQACDAATVRRVAHTLKSSSSSIGALKFAALCADIEASIQPGRTVDFSSVQYVLTRELSGVLRAVRSIQRAPER
jgi:hypothetical protein